MRVIAGEARSLPLKAPNGEGTRPTTDRIKETLFNIMAPYIPGSVFVDLFAGSGAVGIEAISRGARHAYFVENGREPVACITDNLKFTKFEDRATFIKQDVYLALYNIHEKEADIIFLDPPYNMGHDEKVLSILKDMPYVTDNTLIVMEGSLETDYSFVSQYGFRIKKQKLYKTNQHVFIERSEVSE
ncbi:MAG: 16S rRNA (guanine(966)-N(2))-methyltransferase RsmD [Lachnospiraceae bacterium]|nr:16S rRNA (guanine(966)-N(2))-methyltransferase RsmD [Lachnospiraceae bacterium]